MAPSFSHSFLSEFFFTKDKDCFLRFLCKRYRFNTDRRLTAAFRPIHTVAIWKRKAELARERGLLRKYRPLLTLKLEDISAMLDTLLARYIFISSLCSRFPISF